MRIKQRITESGLEPVLYWSWKEVRQWGSHYSGSLVAVFPSPILSIGTRDKHKVVSTAKRDHLIYFPGL
jgi:hypothetical protein